MIKGITLVGKGTYYDKSAKLTGLKELNFIFGSNGSGKTTISRVIADFPTAEEPRIDWDNSQELDSRVYNKDFVERHFDSGIIDGIYTFGEDNIEAVSKIAKLKENADEVNKKLLALERTLSGDVETENGDHGKIKELEKLESEFKEFIWRSKISLKGLEGGFKPLNRNKENFYDQYLENASKTITDTKSAREAAELLKDADRVFSDSAAQASALKILDRSQVSSVESSEILGKQITGKEDIPIAEIIEKLGNSDWVKHGREYFNKLENQCPFCQQKTTEAFRKDLDAYFGEIFTADLNSIDALRKKYEEETEKLLEEYKSPEFINSPHINKSDYETTMSELENLVNANIDLIKEKHNKPSKHVTLHNTEPLFQLIEDQVEEHNNIVNNLEVKKKQLASEIWMRLLVDTNHEYKKFKRGSQNLQDAISSLKGQIKGKHDELKEIEEQIKNKEQGITSIKPTVDKINNTLESLGFLNFKLDLAEDGKSYTVRRSTGENAKTTLSEGEKSFITFLYFYHFISGSLDPSGTTEDKIVVFDDPVSSLDSEVLFIVSRLIKDIIREMHKNSSPIKQLFILTHNIYFHKEISFDMNANKGKAQKVNEQNGQIRKIGKTFWIVRKSPNGSHVKPYVENPIKSSYELLWQQLRQTPQSDITIPNVMRRILEYYFKFYGGKNLESIAEKFNESDKLICELLLSWANDGSHFPPEDLYKTCTHDEIQAYLKVFKQIFIKSGHEGHYNMMMSTKYLPLPGTSEGTK